ncbi:hypothetical protein OIO90_005703 [Microbotryomycetes sp. JL221]|nr:hypothetical protein OIO90_005703 [Microbotryomycetes sp. JL221]
MASLKIGSLLLRTLAKPIANRIKREAKEHERFRQTTISFAQFLHRTEMTMRVKLLGETHPKHIRPLNDARAIDAGANLISESFLFAFAAAIILAESWRSRRKEQNRRDAVLDKIEMNQQEIVELKQLLNDEKQQREQSGLRERDLEKIVEEIVSIGLKGGFVELSQVWAHHNKVGQDARLFQTSERVQSLRDEERDDDITTNSLIENKESVGEQADNDNLTALAAKTAQEDRTARLKQSPFVQRIAEQYRERRSEGDD